MPRRRKLPEENPATMKKDPLKSEEFLSQINYDSEFSFGRVLPHFQNIHQGKYILHTYSDEKPSICLLSQKQGKKLALILQQWITENAQRP